VLKIKKLVGKIKKLVEFVEAPVTKFDKYAANPKSYPGAAGMLAAGPLPALLRAFLRTISDWTRTPNFKIKRADPPAENVWPSM
jgi:hypothetical protein